MYEKGIIIKDWRNIDLSFGLIYPNLYKLGISSYTIRFLYSMINTKENLVCERIHLPKNINYPASKDFSSLERIRSIENNVLPINFDILGFSVHYENDFKNVLWILEKSGIPLKSETRSLDKDNKYPLIIGGGPVVTANPIPLGQFFDVCFIGDAEQNLFAFFDSFLDSKKESYNQVNFLKKLTNIDGLYIPVLKNPVKRIYLDNLDDSPNPIFQLSIDSVYPENKGIFEESFLIEVNRGCPYKCKFCISSFHNSPFRNKSFENISQSIEEAAKSKYKKISLIGSCVSSHPKFYDICNLIISKKMELSIPSIRLEHINSELISILERANIKTITIAPETGADSLRYEIGKKISNQKIIQILTLIQKSKIKNVKFYFLVGLPNESSEDIEDIIALLKNIKELGFSRDKLKVNINPFVPKLNTPFENKCYFYLPDNLNELRERLSVLEMELNKIPSINLKLKNYKVIINNARLQTIISLGDKDISDLLLQYYMNGASMGALRRAEKELNLYIEDYLIKIQNGYVPWKH